MFGESQKYGFERAASLGSKSIFLKSELVSAFLKSGHESTFLKSGLDFISTLYDDLSYIR
jgi:hypothetical protein